MAILRGLDISWCQPTSVMDWPVIAKNASFVIIRCSQADFQDSEWKNHVGNAVAHGVPYGLYHFYQPNLAADKQLKVVYDVWDAIAPANKPKAIFVDVEPIVYTINATTDSKPPVTPDNNLYGRYQIVPQDYVAQPMTDTGKQTISIYPPDKHTHSWWLRTWIEAVKRYTKAYVGVYTRKNYWDEWVLPSGAEAKPPSQGGKSFTMPRWFEHPLWVASWLVYSALIAMPRDWGLAHVWQFEGGTGRNPGVGSGGYPVDLNEFMGAGDPSQDSLWKLFGKPAVIISPPPPPPPPPVGEVTLKEIQAAIKVLQAGQDKIQETLDRIFK